MLRRLLGFHVQVDFSGFPFFADFTGDDADESQPVESSHDTGTGPLALVMRPCRGERGG